VVGEELNEEVEPDWWLTVDVCNELVLKWCEAIAST